jgi:hypothetical protein
VTFAALAADARLIGLLGIGDDTFTFGAEALLASHFLDGGRGTDVVQKVVPRFQWPFTHRNIEEQS